MNKLLASMAVAALMCSPVFAGAGAPVPEKPAGGDPSGRPGEILSDAKCQDVWKSTAAGTGTVTAEQAGPVVANFKMVDADGDGTVSEAEFKEGCKKGMVQARASKPAETGGGQTPENPTE